MRRVISALVITVVGLLALLSFKTRTESTAIASTGSSVSSRADGTDTAARTITGNAATTVWGPVQVLITVAGGKVLGVTAVEYPWTNPMDQRINISAIPQLNQEALAAGSAKIDMISGATYTSQGYVTSLQSALDKAGL